MPWPLGVYRGPPEVYRGPCMKITCLNQGITYTHAMCTSMVDIQCPTAEISRGNKKRRKKKQDENILLCPITLRCLYTQTQLPVSSTSACNNPSLEISEKSGLTVDVIVTITRVRSRVLYSITHGCHCNLPGYCTRKHSARGTLEPVCHRQFGHASRLY